MSKLLKDIAYGLGVRAQKNGDPRIPVCDSVLLENCLIGCKLGEGVPYVTAWLKGWDDANN